MSFVGLIQAFNEAENITGAVESLYSAGCHRVVVVDGAWTTPSGSYFGGRGFLSDDGMADEARGARATIVEPEEQHFTDGSKRDWAVRNCGARDGDHVLILDADERAIGRITGAPAGHGCVVLSNDKPNDLDYRTSWLDAEVRPSVPMLRWLRWSSSLRCVAPGRYEDHGAVEPYLVGALAAQADSLDELGLLALAALRSVEFVLPNDRLSALPLVEGIEISHCVAASPERVAAKHAYYEPELQPA